MATLPPGTRVGSCEILGVLGEGGMGQVLRARDTSLRRDVAIKILPPALAEGAEARARLAREARLLGSLSHAHIAQVYGLEESPAGPAIVMELVQGVTLREHLRPGLARQDAVRLAIHIAMALDAAHERGIVHRDLKPGNIMVTPDGTAKVLDFGLARATAAAGGAITDDTTLAGTIEGAIAGTPKYMSPEQLRGQPVDRRTDIWAFGCILFELLSGKSAFDGHTVSDLSAAILQNEPEWNALPADLPPHLAGLVRRCLEKDRTRRLRDIGDALPELSTSVVSPSARERRSRSAGLVIAVAVGALLTGALSGWLLLGGPTFSPDVADPLYLELSPPRGARFGGPLPNVEAEAIAISPDGLTAAFVAAPAGGAPRIWVRNLGDSAAREIAATNNAISTFFSPDGRSLAFFADGQLKRVDIDGGAPVKICDVPVRVGLSGSWGAQGDILFASVQGDRIWRVPAAGGAPVDAIPPAPERSARTHWPVHLPGGQLFVYTESTPSRQIILVEPDGRRTPLVDAVSRAQWVDPHWLLYVREGTLVAQQIDLAARKPVGESTAVLGSVAFSEATGWSNIAASVSGTILAQVAQDQRKLAWVDAAGREGDSIGPPASYFTLRLAPDDSSLLYTRLRPDVGTYDIWKTDLRRGSEEPVTTSPATEMGETWMPGGGAVLYAAAEVGTPPNVHYKDLATGQARRLMASAWFQYPSDVSRDGQLVLYQQRTEAGTWDVMTVPTAGGPSAPLFASPATEVSARLAPNGSAVAFLSDESGRFQVYVAPFPSAGRKTQASTAGGSFPRWRHDGRELYYVSPDRRLMAVPVDADGVPGTPRALFDVPRWIDYDAARDGRFVAVISQVVAAEQPLTVIVNWRR